MASFRRALVRVNCIFNITSNQTSVSSFRSQFGWLSRYSTENKICDNPSIDFELSNEERKRRLFNRLVYRSKQRGFLELDLVMGKWVEEHIYSMDANRIKALIDVLDLENPDLWKWLTGQEQIPEKVNINPVFRALRGKVMDNLNCHTAPDTRALPGQQWVKGWDDFKKGAGSPVAGNQ